MASVTLLVYGKLSNLNSQDLSQGMARMMSMGMVGKQIDGIWHTAVVVYGKEYCFGQGIEEFHPTNSPYGRPINTIDMGQTEIPKELFLEYMNNMKTIWTKEKYHLFDNNCNSFSDEVCQFLVGKGIPSHITGLPAEVLNTPFGQMIRPMIENIYGPSSHSNPILPSNPSRSIENTAKQVLISCTSLSNLKSLISSNRCVVIDFTSQNCPPCRVISPEFEALIQEANSPKEKVVGVKVETSVSRDICNEFQITATPTFQFFLDGKLFHQFRGADRRELKSNLDLLLYTAFPPHPHTKLRFKIIDELAHQKAVQFTKSSNLEMIFKKLKEIIQQSNPSFKTESLDTIKNWMTKTDYQNNSILPHDWNIEMDKLLLFLPIDKIFPLLDIYRLLVLNPSIRKFVMNNSTFLKDLNERLTKGECIAATKLMHIKLMTNVFEPNEPKANSKIMAEPFRPILTNLVIDSLLSSNIQVRQAAALLAFNMSWSACQLHSDSLLYNEDWSMEMLAAVINSLETELAQDKEKSTNETVFRLLGSAALILVGSSKPLTELANLTGLNELLNSALKLQGDERKDLISNVCQDLTMILN